VAEAESEESGQMIIVGVLALLLLLATTLHSIIISFGKK
jgi:hypothetical protein